MRSAAELDAWLTERDKDELAEHFTYVVGLDGLLRLAPRRSEHVACAGGAEVLGAGEMGFGRAAGLRVVGEVSNQSTGYCPHLDSWPAVARALDRAGIDRPAPAHRAGRSTSCVRASSSVCSAGVSCRSSGTWLRKITT